MIEGKPKPAPRTMAELEGEALIEIESAKYLSCTELGERLWSGWYGCKSRQSYARPAGKVIQRLLQQGRIQMVYPDGVTRPVYGIVRTCAECGGTGGFHFHFCSNE